MQGNTIDWCGYKWVVRNQGSSGPGPNNWSSQNVFIDQQGNLHLKITRTGQGWQCAQLSSVGWFEPNSNFQWQIVNRVDQLDRNIVLGLFMYPPNGMAPDTTNEIDIEFSQWGNSNSQRLWYTLWPKDKSKEKISSGTNFVEGGPTTHRFRWGSSSISYRSLRGAVPPEEKGGVFAAWQTPAGHSSVTPTMRLEVHMNLWLVGGNPPTDGKEVEVVIRSFKNYWGDL